MHVLLLICRLTGSVEPNSEAKTSLQCSRLKIGAPAIRRTCPIFCPSDPAGTHVHAGHRTITSIASKVRCWLQTIREAAQCLPHQIAADFARFRHRYHRSIAAGPPRRPSHPKRIWNGNKGQLVPWTQTCYLCFSGPTYVGDNGNPDAERDGGGRA